MIINGRIPGILNNAGKTVEIKLLDTMDLYSAL